MQVFEVNTFPALRLTRDCLHHCWDTIQH